MDPTLRPIQPPKVERGFEDSRAKLADILSQLTFMRVSVISLQATDPRRPGTHFQGEAVEVHPGHGGGRRGPPRVAFFSRFSRQTGAGFNLLGGFTLIDSPVGVHHSSAVPQVGDILVGSLMPAAKGKIPFELRGWSANAKPLLELSRVVQFGTRASEAELRRLLRQPAADAASALLRLNISGLSEAEKTHAKAAAASADDFWFLTRVVCFGKLSEDSALKLSKPWTELIDSLAMRFGDEQLLDAWSTARPKEQEKEYNYAAAYAPSYSAASAAPSAASFAYPAAAPVAAAAAAAPVHIGYGQFTQSYWSAGGGAAAAAATAYDPSKMFAGGAAAPAASARPTTPPIAADASGATQYFVPSSPTYAPSSPTYAPSSPVYRPSTPKNISEIKDEEL